ncbi:MAG: hypothetical protein KKC19_03395 [Nanoarchaeota archaeon]|nr:hypothetical protein [Nanoarchaeota archaeon]
MGIFSFLKKFGKKEEIEKVILEKLVFSEIENWMDKKRVENEAKENEILILVKGKIKYFHGDLGGKIIILNEFDVESKNVEDKIKRVVNDNRAQYIESVKNFMADLENIEETKFSELTKKIDRIFFDFNKASFKNYERATILIGKEMANIKDTFKTFSSDLLEIFNNNKELTESFQRIELIKSKLDSLGSIDRNKERISKEIASISEKINQMKKENDRTLDKIKEIKQSADYLNMLERREKIILLEEDLKNNISRLRRLIDFKALANFFHINQEQMSLVKNHREDFHVNFEKDNGERIIGLLDMSKLNNDEIKGEMEKISSKLGEVENNKEKMKEDKTRELYFKIKEIVIKIESLKIEKIREEKRDEKLKANEEELMSSLKQELGKMNVELMEGDKY